MDLGRIGIWSGAPLAGPPEAVGEMAAAVEAAGYGALWLPGGAGGDVLERCGLALAGTESLVLATGILNIWRHEPADVVATTQQLRQSSGDRFLLGLGVPAEAIEPSEKLRYFDTRLYGKSAGGHTFPEELSEDEKLAVLEYLKTI